MGRKRKEGSDKNYFGHEEELAVLEYLYGDPEKKNEVYRTKLKYPFEKMVESIIKKYRLYRDDISIEDLAVDTLSFLITKFDKFNPNNNTKAYSYYGTIC